MLLNKELYVLFTPWKIFLWCSLLEQESYKLGTGSSSLTPLLHCYNLSHSSSLLWNLAASSYFMWEILCCVFWNLNSIPENNKPMLRLCCFTLRSTSVVLFSCLLYPRTCSKRKLKCCLGARGVWKDVNWWIPINNNFTLILMWLDLGICCLVGSHCGREIFQAWIDRPDPLRSVCPDLWPLFLQDQHLRAGD